MHLIGFHAYQATLRSAEKDFSCSPSADSSDRQRCHSGSWGGLYTWFAPRRTSKHTIPFDVAGGYGISRVEVKIDFQPNRESCELLSVVQLQTAAEVAKGTRQWHCGHRPKGSGRASYHFRDVHPFGCSRDSIVAGWAPAFLTHLRSDGCRPSL